MKALRFTVIFLLQLSAISASAVIIAGPVDYPSNGHRYYLLAANRWVDSENEAISLGGHLVTINDLAENQWVFDTFGPIVDVQIPSPSDFSPAIWLGLTDAALEGTFTWVSGEPLLFIRWDVGQPNNSGGDQDYVQMRVRPSVPQSANPSFWNDYNNFPSPSDQFGVVEIVPEPSCLVLTGIGASSLIIFRRRP